MILQGRDLKLFHLLIRFGLLSTPQISALAFAGIATATMLRRLRLLEQDNYVRRGVTLPNATNTWLIASKGIQSLGHGHQYHFTNRNGIQHDVLLTDVRIALERLNLGKDWTPEFEIRAARMRNEGRTNHPPLIPDGLMVESIRGKTKAIAMELELIRKSHKRYEKILDGYSVKSVSHIWYIVNQIGTANAILKAANSRSTYSMVNRLWFSLLDELLKGIETSRIFSCAHKKWIGFSDVGFDALKVSLPAQTSAHGVSTRSEEKSFNDFESMSLNFKTNAENQPPGGGTISGPDHTPPTTGGGVVWSGPEIVEEKEIGGVDKYKKCG